MSSLGAAGGPGSPIRSSQPLTIPEDEEVQDPDVATLLSDLFSGDWGAEPTPAASAPQSSAGQDKQQGGNSRPLQAAQDAGGGSFVLRSDAPAPLPPGDARQPREEPFPGFRMSPPGVGDFQTRGAPAIKKKPGILSSLTAGPAFLQKQLRKAQAGAGGSPSPPKGEAPKPGGGRQKLPLKHAVTEPTSKLLDFLRDARAGGADVPEPLIQQISSMEPQQEEQAELFLPASAAHNSVPFYRRRGFWVSNLLLLLWSLTFVGAGLGLLLESQDCPTGCPGPKNTARLLPPLDPECACWGTPSLEQCGFNSPDACSSACGCVSLQHPCWADGCDAGKIGNDSIPWRVMFFLACIPVAAWASQILGWLFVSLISGIEAWAERKEQRQQQREAAARLQQELELELRKRQQLEGEKQRALARMATLGSGKLGGSGSGQLGGGSGSGELPAAPVGPATAPKTGPARPQIGSVVSWQAGLLERAAASAKLAGDVPAPLEHASILPPAPQNPAGGAAAALLDGASGMSEVVAAKTQEAPKAVEVSERSLASGLARFLLGLEASYLAEHIRPQIQRCVFMGLATGFWAIFWSISYNNVVPDHNSRFWVFFRVLLCLTLMLVVNLITCFVSSLAGIKLKRMNHRARMLEVSKREALLQLLLSKGLEDEDDPRAANKLLPPELQPPEAREAPEGNGPTAPRQSLSWRSRGKLLGFGNTLLPLARLSQAVSTTFGSEKRSSSLPNNKGENGDIEQARDGGQGGEALRRSATDTGARRWGGRGLDRSRSGSGHSVEPPPSPLTSPKSSGSLGLANGAGDSGLPSPSAGSATSGAAPPAPNGPAAAAGAPPVAERQRVALTSRAGDLSKAHMLADRERHFLEDELRLKYWNARAEALPGPGGVPLTGREDSTVVSSEEDAASLGRFVFHRRLLAFVKLRAQLVKEAKGRQEAEQAKAAAERASKAREEAAAKAAKAAEAGGTGEGGAGAAFVRDLSMRAVAESIPGLLDMFGSSTEDEEGVAASASAPPPAQGPAAGGPVWAPPLAAAAPGPGRPMARTASGTPARTPLQGPFAGSPRGEATRKQLFAAGGGSAGPAAPAVPGEATPGGALTARSYASRSSAGRREGLDKDMLRHFLEARGAGSETDYAFDVLDRDYDDFITEENVVRMVRQLYKDRLNLRKGLEGTNTILRKLDVFIGAVLHAIFIIFYLLVWGVAFNDSFYNAFSALLLAFSFIFQSTITNLYENVVFIFVIHPYDVGDMLLLSCTSCGSSSRHEVEEIHLNYTRFLDKENGRVWWPNRTLRDTAFINLTTSEIMEDNFHLLLDLDVAARHPDLLRKIKARLDDYCRKHRGEFDTTGTSVTYRDIMSPMGVLMKAEWRYSHPGTSKERCAKARTGLLIFAAQVLTELGVRYSWPNPFRPGDAPSCHGLGGHAGTAPGPGGSRHVGRSMSSESLPAQMRGPSAGAAPGRPGSQQQQQLRGGSVGPLGGSGPSGPQHTRSGSGLQSLADPLQQPVGAPGGEGGPARVRRTESSETVAADVPLHRLASMGEASGLAGSPSFSRGSMDGQAGLPPSGPPRSRAGGAEAAGRGSALAPAGRLSGATLAPTAAGRGARAALVLGNTIEEPGQHPEQLRLLPEAQIP